MHSKPNEQLFPKHWIFGYSATPDENNTKQLPSLFSIKFYITKKTKLTAIQVTILLDDHWRNIANIAEPQ